MKFRFEIKILLPDTRHTIYFIRSFNDWEEVDLYIKGLTIDPNKLHVKIVLDTGVVYLSWKMLNNAIISVMKV